MAQRGVSSSTLIINNETILYVPNSLTYTLGYGEDNQRVATSGGGSVEFIISKNVETKIATVKFQIFNTVQAFNWVQNWKLANDSGLSAITVSNPQFTKDFIEMLLITDPEHTEAFDGTIDVEFKGRGLV